MKFAETATCSGTPTSYWRTHLVAGTALLSGLFGVPVTAADHALVAPQCGTGATFPNQLIVPRVEEARARSAADAILEVRRLSGLTWQELADVLNVHRRTLHLWANRRPINAPNEQRVQRLLGTLRKIDRGEAVKTRSLLLEARLDGPTLLDILAEGDFGKALAVAGSGPGRSQGPTSTLSREAREARRPPRPADLVGGLDYPAHDHGRLVREKTTHLKPRKMA